MDIKEYISSGILELYAAGGLSESECAEVERMATEHPEVRAELEAIQKALVGYASAYKKNPRPELRQSVLDKIDEIEGKPVNVVPFTPPQQSDSSISKKLSTMRYLLAAVIVFFVLNFIGSVIMFNKWKSTDEQLTVLVQENRNMRLEYEKVKQTLDKKSNDMHMVMNRTNKIVDMKGMEISPASMATVYWNPGSKKVMLNVESLPRPPEGMQYQLWALKDGKPVDAGVFDMVEDPMHMMDTPIEGADAFAVTLEKMGGSPVPTLTQLYVMGKL